jgi:uncharacterized protein (DUF433 family)
LQANISKVNGIISRCYIDSSIIGITSFKAHEMSMLDRITLEAGKRGGKPCVRNLRISVYDVLGWLANGQTEAEILHDYPELELADIRACLAFAAAREHHGSLIRAA